MTNLDQRIDRTIAAMSEAEKRKLLDAHIGKMLPGREPQPELDAEYLRGIVLGQLKEEDAKEQSGIAELEQRVAVLERRKPSLSDNYLKGLMSGIGEVVADQIREAFASSGFMVHCGSWDAERENYASGNCVIHDGAMWMAVAEVAKGARPSKALEWRLVVKSDSRVAAEPGSSDAKAKETNAAWDQHKRASK